MRHIFALAFALLFIPWSVQATVTEHHISVTRADGSNTAFTPFDGPIGSMAAGDLGTDGTYEIITGAAAESPPLVRVFRQDGSMIGEFFAYAENFTRGVNVAVCDLDGDNVNEIVTGAKFGGGPHVRIFTNMGTPKLSGFFAYDENFRGGVQVACGDVDNDGLAEIVTGPGLSGGPHLKIFSAAGDLKYETFNGDATMNTGAYVAVRNGSIATARIGVGDATITHYAVRDGTLASMGTIDASPTDYFATVELENNGSAIADIASELAQDTSAKYIRVDISEQRLTMYEHGIEVYSFLVSTGVRGYDTPLGKTEVLAKLPVHDYRWYYGEGDARNYNIPNVKWNLRFREHYYIHSAYWHNNFGNRMSHGCVNTSIPDAEWIFNWADVGTPVEIVQ